MSHSSNGMSVHITYLQCYTVYGGTRFVDLGLQTHRIKCRVHDDFKSAYNYLMSYYTTKVSMTAFCNRLILIAEKEVVYDRFPTPLINRLEKHIVDTSTILSKRQERVFQILKKWIDDFNCVENHEYV